MKKANIVILMATFNGDRYLKEQINSILRQTYSDWHLVIRDDGSTDNTVNILNFYKNAYPDKISVIVNKSNKHGAKENFLFLSKIALKKQYKYIMYSDQDDIWKIDKIDITLRKLKEIEKDKNIPVLVHTDLEVVDNNLNVIAPSFIKYSKLDNNDSFSHLLIQNNITGCTMLINRALLLKSLSIKNNKKIIMHDWWFALIASVFGKVIFLSKPTILYRQHGDNVVGAKKINLYSMSKKIFKLSDNKRSILQTIDQASVLSDNYTDLPLKKEKVISGYSQIKSKNKIERIYFVRHNDVLKNDLVRRLGEYVFI